MRKSQWNVLGWIFFLISIYLVYWTSLTGSIYYSHVETMQAVAVFVVNRIYSIAVFVTFGFAVACWVNAWLEGRAEKKEEKERDDELWRDAKEKDFVMKVAQKLELERLPQDIPELVFWGKKEGKEKEVDEAVKEWTERELLRLTMLQEKYGGKLSQEDKEWLIEKKKKYPDEYVG